MQRHGDVETECVVIQGLHNEEEKHHQKVIPTGKKNEVAFNTVYFYTQLPKTSLTVFLKNIYR